MRSPMTLTTPILFGTALLTSVAAAMGDEVVRPVVRWSGTVGDPALLKHKPQSGIITSQKDFADIWKAWRSGEQIPDIDFENHFAFVATAAKQKMFVIQLNVDKDGRAAPLGGQLGSDKDIPGFGYGLAVFPRAKVKSIGNAEVK
jgi:hypothetical protein